MSRRGPAGCYGCGPASLGRSVALPTGRRNWLRRKCVRFGPRRHGHRRPGARATARLNEEAVPPPEGTEGAPPRARVAPTLIRPATAAATVAAAGTAATATTVLARLGLVDGECPAVGLVAVQGRDRGLGLIVVGHLDEAE